MIGLWFFRIIGILFLVLYIAVPKSSEDVPRPSPSPVQAVVVVPASGPKGTTVEITGGPCPAAPEGEQLFGIYFGLSGPRAEAEKENPTGSAPLIPGKPWKGQLRIPHGVSVGQYVVYAGCSVTEAEGTKGSPFYKYENSTFEVVER